MILLIMLILILSISFGIKILLNIKQEEAIFISLFGIGLFTYIFGIINLLWISPYVIIMLSIASMTYTIIKLVKKEEKIKDLLTLPTIIYMIITCIIYYITKDIQYENYDEYMFWGINLKEMINNSCLWANSKIEGIHLIYPPFTAVVEYVFCIFGNGFSESISYFAIILLIFTSLMPLFKNEKYTIKSFIKVSLSFIITYVAIVFFQYNIANLSVDCILGVIFGVSMYAAYTVKEKKDYITLIILLVSLTLIKTNGILLAGIVIMQLFFKEIFIVIKNKEKNLKKILKQLSIIVILLAIVLANYGIWKIYYTVNGKQIDARHDMNNVDNVDIIEFINAILQREDASNRNKNIALKFWNNILELKITQNNKFNSLIYIFALVNIIHVIYIILNKNKLNLILNLLSMNIGLILYLITTLVVFMFVFQSDQGNMLMGYERYVQTYMLAMVLDLIYIFLENMDLKSGICIIIILTIMCLGLNNTVLDPRKNRLSIEEKTIQNAKDILESVNENEKVYIIDQKANGGTEFMRTRYLICPIQTNLLYEWNIGYSTSNIFYRMIITEKKLFEKLIEEDYDYVYIIDIDKNFTQLYGNILSEEVINELQDKSKYHYYKEPTPGILLKINREKNILDIAN